VTNRWRTSAAPVEGNPKTAPPDPIVSKTLAPFHRRRHRAEDEARC